MSYHVIIEICSHLTLKRCIIIRVYPDQIPRGVTTHYLQFISHASHSLGTPCCCSVREKPNHTIVGMADLNPYHRICMAIHIRCEWPIQVDAHYKPLITPLYHTVRCVSGRRGFSESRHFTRQTVRVVRHMTSYPMWYECHWHSGFASPMCPRRG